MPDANRHSHRKSNGDPEGITHGDDHPHPRGYDDGHTHTGYGRAYRDPDSDAGRAARADAVAAYARRNAARNTNPCLRGECLP